MKTFIDRMIANFPQIDFKKIVYALFGVLVIVLALTVHPDTRNERVECLSLTGNPYEHTPESGHIINTGLVSFAMFHVINDYRVLAVMFWVIMFLITYRHINNWVLLSLFMILVLRTVVYQHEEIYFGLPFVYLGMFSKNQIIKGIATGISMTVRPVYLAFLLPYLIPNKKNYYVWGAGILTCGLCYMAGLFVYGESFLLYNNITSIFRGGAEINYTMFFLDYALLILIPIIWSVD